MRHLYHKVLSKSYYFQTLCQYLKKKLSRKYYFLSYILVYLPTEVTVKIRFNHQSITRVYQVCFLKLEISYILILFFRNHCLSQFTATVFKFVCYIALYALFENEPATYELSVFSEKFVSVLCDHLFLCRGYDISVPEKPLFLRSLSSDIEFVPRY